jgi:hypothetical protein
MVVYIVANNKFLNPEHFKLINEDDIVFVANGAIWFDYINNKNIYYFLRRASLKRDLFHGEKNYEQCDKNKIKKTILFNFKVSENVTEKYKKLHNNIEEINCNQQNYFPKHYHYTNKHLPSTGFYMLDYQKKYFPNEKVVLLGFNPLNSKYYKCPLHDYVFECKYYKDNNIEILL